MKTKKRIALFLSLLLALSLILPTSAAFAEEEKDSGMEISKTATANGDGTYTITLEAYATGSKVISEVKKDVPTDIVLVLDRSGSMKENMSTTSFRQYADEEDRWYTTYHTRNQDYYSVRHNQEDGTGITKNLYYPLDDGSYASVSVQLDAELIYAPIKNQNNNYYYTNRNSLFAKVNNEYYPASCARNWNQYTYTYVKDNETITITSSTGYTETPNFENTGIDDNVLYLGTTVNTYTYTYTDKDGETKLIGTSTGATERPEFGPLYEKYSDSITRMEALKTAATGFIDSVATKAKGENEQDSGDDVAHRLAVVSYASDTTNHTGGLLDMTNSTNVDAAKNAVNGLTANGGTLIDGGIRVANTIFESNPISANDTSGRQRVVIVFTDGAPGRYGDWEEDSRNTAKSAISNAEKTKNTYGATVYTIGIFDGADASDPSKLPTYSTSNLTDSKRIDNSNRFMHLVSSNYPNATSMTATGSLNPNLNGDSYYLSASDSNTLNNIFQQIAENIESGGSATTLDENTVIKDIISPQFILPEGATITLETYSYTGENQWTKNNNAMGATAVVNGDQVSVRGFDFSENWCGTETNNGTTTYHGNKLVISFDVVVKEGFLGGNGVYTNTSAGVYENSSAEKPVFEFERPQVDVAIKGITVTPEEKNVYLLQDLTVSELYEGSTVKVGDVTLDITKPTENWGLQPWQTEYVNITVEVKDKDGKVITDSDLTDLTDDKTYTVSVTVSPKTTGTATAQTGTGNANINVFKPELTFKDSDVYYGAAVPTDFTGNKVDSVVWKHGDKTSTDQGVTMIGDVPTLGIAYTPDANKITDGKVNTKQDIPVKVEVKIDDTDVNQYVTFKHQDCSTGCGWNETVLDGDPAFLLHVKTCQLTITKQSGADGEPYVFTVKKDGTVYSEVTIVGNGSETIYELPVGTYTIEENTGWSWRFNPSYSKNVVLSKDNTSGMITCTNTKDENLWLNGFSSVVKNIFGVSHNN